MTVLLIILGLLGVLALLTLSLLLIHLCITLEVAEEMQLWVRVLCFRVRILPRKEKRYRIGRYTLKKIRRRDARRAKREARRALKKQKAQEAQKNRPPQPEKKKGLSEDAKKLLKGIVTNFFDLLPLLCRVLARFSSRFVGGLHLRIHYLHVRIGASDAMQTAVLYGAVNQAVQYFIAYLDKITHMDKLRSADISVEPDFLSEKVEFEMKLTLRVNLLSILRAAWCALWRFIVGFIQHKSAPEPSIIPPLPPFPVLPEAPDARS